MSEEPIWTMTILVIYWGPQSYLKRHGGPRTKMSWEALHCRIQQICVNPNSTISTVNAWWELHSSSMRCPVGYLNSRKSWITSHSLVIHPAARFVCILHPTAFSVMPYVLTAMQWLQTTFKRFAEKYSARKYLCFNTDASVMKTHHGKLRSPSVAHRDQSSKPKGASILFENS